MMSGSDRYVHYIIPFALILAVKAIKDSKVLLLSASLALAVLFFISYQVSMDFITWQSATWSRSLSLVSEKNISPIEINGTRAWDRFHREGQLYEDTQDSKYVFSFDSPDEQGENEKLILVETLSTDFFGSIFVDPKVYLYMVTGAD